MAEAQLRGVPNPKPRKNLGGVKTAADLVNRDFARAAPNQLWLTDITEHPTREGKVYCCVVLDATIVNVALPSIRKGRHFSPSKLK